MNLPSALEEFGLLQRRRRRGEEGQRAAAALAALREFLVDYSGFESTEDVSASDLMTFLLEYYPAEEELDAQVALALLDAAGGFALWLLERGERGLAPFAAREERLREDLPRVVEALALLKEHARREDIESSLTLDGAEGEAEIGSVGSGLSRVARLDEVDYAAAEDEYYTVRQSREGALELHSAERRALGEGPVGPVPVPARAVELLRAGDIIHAEVAPGPAGWELLEVFGIRPGGYE